MDHATKSWWNAQLARRPWWMNLLFFFCLYMAVIHTPADLLFTPVARDEEVWFGIMFTGWSAKLLTIPHWIVYGLGAYGFWRMRPWMWPWAAAYAAQVAFSMLVWGLTYSEGFLGALGALLSPFPFLGLAAVLVLERERFEADPMPPIQQRYGSWALVTGASSGIGAEFARALARHGVSVVLAARRRDRLAALAGEIAEVHGVATRVVEVDLGTPGGAEQLADAVADLDIGLLVNNAGYGYAGRFDRQETDRLRAMVTLNCVTPAVLTSRLIGGMRMRGRGAVIIVGSIAGRQPLPLNGVYAATKAFDLHFGEALWAEMQGTGIDVLVVEPGPTATEFQEAAGETPHAGEPPGNVVRIALESLGRQPSVISGWANYLRGNAARFLPRSLAALVAGRVMAQWTPPERQ
ncbi:MAG TPA: SDR family NAD(P)-dependent oxidoreductase [Candidatus Limnocylindria bacterium]|nr:SDR family NAD(P)-dependent oxidoreductase [Candidatus Limnocylindria bacterium]